MGMYDNFYCDYPLDCPCANVIDWQTKDTPAQSLDYYKIDEDGQLWHQEYDIEDQSDPNAEGLGRILGCATRVNERWVKVTDFSGAIRFYGFPDYGRMDDVENWWEYEALLQEGKLLNLVRIFPKPESDGGK